MASGEAPFLTVGTEVSAKYRGAFCEAKVKKLVKTVKCKVIFKETSHSAVVTDDLIKGPLKIGSNIEVRHPDSGEYVEATLGKVTDTSMYTVVFDDGDERTLRRTQLCLKGEKHFVESETLDQLPLTHPEHFGTPVMQQNKKAHKRRSTLSCNEGSTDEDSDSSEDTPPPKRRTYVGRLQDCIGKVVSVDSSDKRKGSWFPALVVLPSAADVPLKTKGHVLVRSFRDSRYAAVLKKETKEFTRDTALKCEEKALKSSIEKALLYMDNHELPPSWVKDELLGTDEESDGSEDETSDDEPSEEKDRFVAQLYKFMDDRGTPINKAPIIGMKDLNLYRLFKVVQNIGGYNKVTNQMKWRLVYSKMSLPPSNNASTQIKSAYKKYLHAFEDFYRKLGSTMGTISRPSRSRHSSGRSLLSFREREKESPKSPKHDRRAVPTHSEDGSPPKADVSSIKSDIHRSSNRDSSEEKKSVEKAVTRSDDRRNRVVKDIECKKEDGQKVEKKSPSAKLEKVKVEEKKGVREFTRSMSRTEERKAAVAAAAAAKEESKDKDDEKTGQKKGVKMRLLSEKKGPKSLGKEEKKGTQVEERKGSKDEVKPIVKDNEKKNVSDESKAKKDDEKKGKNGEKKGKKDEEKSRKDEEKSRKDEEKNRKDEEKSRKDEKGRKDEEKSRKDEEKSRKEDDKKLKKEEKKVQTKEEKVDEKSPDKSAKAEEKAGSPSKVHKVKESMEANKPAREMKRKRKADKDLDKDAAQDTAVEVKKGKKEAVRQLKDEKPSKEGTIAKGRKSELKKGKKEEKGPKEIDKPGVDVKMPEKDLLTEADNGQKDGNKEQTMSEPKKLKKDKTTEDSDEEPRKRPARKKFIASKEWPPESGQATPMKKAKEDVVKKAVKPVKAPDDAKPSDKLKKGKGKPAESDQDVDDSSSRQSEDSSSIERKSKKEADFPVGTKLKVKYGRGRNHKVYEAKVMEAEEEHGSMHYLVHYNGWNTRYDEWVKKERIVGRVNAPAEQMQGDGKKVRTSSQPLKNITSLKGKSSLLSKHTPGWQPGGLSRAHSTDSKLKKPGKSPTRGRPTRSNSVEMPFPVGLPPKRRVRKLSGHTESSDVASHVSDSDSDEDIKDTDNDESMPKIELEKSDHEALSVSNDGDVEPEVTADEETEVEKIDKTSVAVTTEISDEDSTDIKSENIELGETLDAIIDRIGDGEENQTAVNQKDTEEVPIIEEEKVVADAPSIPDTKEEIAVDATCKETPEPKEPSLPVYVEHMKPESKSPECASSVDDVLDIDLSCKEMLDPLVDVPKVEEVSSVKLEQTMDHGLLRPTGDDLIDEVAREIVESQDNSDDEIEPEDGYEDDMKNYPCENESEVKYSSDYMLWQEGIGEKRECHKGKKKKHRSSKESRQRNEGDGEDVFYTCKKKGKKKKDTPHEKKKHMSGDKKEETGSAEKRKKKARKRRREQEDHNSDDGHQDLVEKVAKDLCRMREESFVSAVNDSYSVNAIFDGNIIKTESKSPQPSHSGANLLHDLASAACKEAAAEINHSTMSSAVLENTPPTTPEGSPTGAGSGMSAMSPCNEEVQSTKSEHEANVEVAHYMAGESHSGAESPNPCDTSIVSNCSGGSSGNMPSSESGTELCGTKRKTEDEEEDKPLPKKKRRSRKGKAVDKKHSGKQPASDSDELPEGDISSPIHKQREPSHASPTKKAEPRSPRPSKYNFYLDDAEDMEREKKIEIIQQRIQEIRKIYMQLKAEVALIDRRRKRARRKEREAAAQHVSQSSVSESPVCS